ncbi:Dabb family protein [Acidovorax sp.]|uniref:Dabb family protein n=1 Tax=Acidovorax sp. TaxID=1872122 RepID=UPI003D0371AF
MSSTHPQTIRHIVMWNVQGDTPAERQHNIERLRASFASLKGCIPGLRHLEIGVDVSRTSYACDVVLYSEFDSPEALAAYAEHPEHLRVRAELGAMRTARYQVDYPVAAA